MADEELVTSREEYTQKTVNLVIGGSDYGLSQAEVAFKYENSFFNNWSVPQPVKSIWDSFHWDSQNNAFDIGGYGFRIVDNRAQQGDLLRAKTGEYGRAMSEMLPWVDMGALPGIVVTATRTAPKIAEDLLKNVKFKNVIKKSAKEVNKWWEKVGYDKPPYREGTKVFEVELQETTNFVRVYDDVNSFQKGGWLMQKKDIAGLTAEQIKDKYALKYTPKFVVDVKLSPKTKIRVGEANEIPGWGDGGGIQIDLLNERVGEFFNPRPIEGKWW